MTTNYGYPVDNREMLFDDDVRPDGPRNTQYQTEPRENDVTLPQRYTQNKNNGVTFQEDIECVCGARQHMQRLQHEIRRRYKQVEHDHTRIRQRYDELKKKERYLTDTERELALREEEMKSYKTYLQDKQHSISQLQAQNDATQRALLQRLDECAALEEECRRRLSEYESGLGDMGKKEVMLNETARNLNARKDEIERLEHKLLLETERLKDLRDQCATAREQISQELKQHRRRVDEELEQLEVQKKKISDMESNLLDEKSAFEDYIRAKKRELEVRLREITESNDTNDAIANELKKREEVLNRELQRLQAERDEIKAARDKIKAEWDKVNEALDEIRAAKTELKGIKRACHKQKRILDEEFEHQSRQLNLSHAEPPFPYPQSPISIANYRDIKQAEVELQTRAKHVELAAEELRAKHLELSEYAAQLKQRERALKEGELKLEQLQDALDRREKELEELQEELMNTHTQTHQHEAQMQEYREQMALLAIERNSLEGQKVQFEKQKLAKEAELNATRQRLERKEQELDAKAARYRGIRDAQQLESRLESMRNAKTTSSKVSNRTFTIPTKPAATLHSSSLDHVALE
ncbi:hypothetical protein X943_003351 [Babesia divergens]|uniref:Uncharacterized protein n=1 Tax=Babesia divergens TaxID=32595 RepID=A0AAD9LEJ7_BABDI|nr:hypothetical protein X943_003351 [Babesia divergens]